MSKDPISKSGIQDNYERILYLSLSNNFILLLNLCLTPINLRLIVSNNYLLCLFDVLLSVVSCICLKKEVKIRNIVKEVQNLLRNLKT